MLSTYYARYGEALPVDGWGIHNFILRECQDGSVAAGEPVSLPASMVMSTMPLSDLPISANDDFELFKEQIVRFRQWLADRGYRGAPVYLTEYGVLMPDMDFG